MASPYQPIRCDLHDQLLALATTRQRCTIEYHDGLGHSEQVISTIVDVYTQAGAEYLRLANDQVLRLDALVRVNDQKFR